MYAHFVYWFKHLKQVYNRIYTLKRIPFRVNNFSIILKFIYIE